MSDLISRLRGDGYLLLNIHERQTLDYEAADELDRLNAQALELCAEISGLRRENERLREWQRRAANLLPLVPRVAGSDLACEVALLMAIERTAVQPSAAHAFCGEFPEQSEDERNLRFMLALRCGEPGELYGDDGELQLGGFPYPIDFRRDSVQEIRRKLAARGMAKLAEQMRNADPTDGAA